MGAHKFANAGVESAFDVVRGVREVQFWMGDVGKQLV